MMEHNKTESCDGLIETDLFPPIDLVQQPNDGRVHPRCWVSVYPPVQNMCLKFKAVNSPIEQIFSLSL